MIFSKAEKRDFLLSKNAIGWVSVSSSSSDLAKNVSQDWFCANDRIWTPVLEDVSTTFQFLRLSKSLSDQIIAHEVQNGGSLSPFSSDSTLLSSSHQAKCSGEKPINQMSCNLTGLYQNRQNRELTFSSSSNKNLFSHKKQFPSKFQEQN